MFFKILALLSIFQVIFAADSTNGHNSTDIKVLAANIYDDAALTDIQQRLDLLQIMNENLRLKIDSLETTLNHQLQLQRNGLEKGNDQENCKYSNENLIDIRSELNEQFTMQRNEWKKDLVKLKAALTSQERSIVPVDSEKANNPENCKSFCENYIDDITKPATAMQPLPTNCDEALKQSGHNGIYKIQIPDSVLEPLNVYCLNVAPIMLEEDVADTYSTNNTSPWLVIQRRQEGSIDFYRNWTEYQHGFGNLEGEFFVGLDKLHALTQSTTHELLIQLEDSEGIERWAKYESFAISGENELYELNTLGNYTGTAGDSLRYHEGMKWTTFDSDNDLHESVNCAEMYKGAWWYNACLWSNLNGMYGNRAYGEGVIWFSWHGINYSLKYVQMAIRPVQ